MHPPILSRYIFNILYNVMTRLINWETFNTNDDEYLKLVVGMRRTTSEVCNHSTMCPSKEKRNPPSLSWRGCQMV